MINFNFNLDTRQNPYWTSTNEDFGAWEQCDVRK